MIFLRDYLKILIPLLVAFALYHAAIVPILEPKSIKEVSHWVTPAIPTSDDWWTDFFQEGEWQRDKKNPPRVVTTETSILLFQTREQISDKHWLLKPVTILLPQRNSGTSKRAVLIKNNEGAKIEFKTAVDWTQELPPIVSGQLLGEISIFSPPDDASKNNGMLINARDVRINKRQIWTNQQIRLQLGNSVVEGSDLQIYLDKDLLTAEKPLVRNNSPFNGLDRLELTYVERVHVGLEPGGLWPRKDVADSLKRAAYATLKCGGSFEFDFHQSLATLKKGVQMEHIVQGLPIDTFDCNELRMQVGWRGKQTPSAGTTDSSGSNWTVERLWAFGAAGKNTSDHSGWLKLNAPGMQAEATGQHLVMDFMNGMVTLSNRLPVNNAREMTPAYLRRESVQVWSPEVHYQSASALANAIDEPGKSTSASTENRVGALQAYGAGRAQIDNQGDAWKLSWGERLIVRPDPNDLDKDVVDIKGSANISSPAHGRFRSEQLYLWLTPVTTKLAAQLAPQYPDGNVPKSLPDRMMADGKVDVDSPSLRASVEKMQVWFVYEQSSKSASFDTRVSAVANSTPNRVSGMESRVAALPISMVNNADDKPTANLNLLPSTGMAAPPLKQPVSPTVPARTGGLLAANPVSPMIVTAKTMRAKVSRIGSQSRIEDLILDGSFALTKSQLSDDSPWPFTATGDQLQLSQTQNDTSDITIVGQPAKVAVGSGWVVAPELKLKQSENQFWIDHPGELVIPIEALQKNFASPSSTNLVSLPSSSNGRVPSNAFTPSRSLPSSNGSNIRWHEPPRVQWGKRMTFDGRTALFGGGVTINCRMETDPKTLWHVEARSNQLSVEMEQPVSLRNANSGNQPRQSQISVIRLEENVDLQAVQTDLEMQRRSIEHMKVPQLDIMVPTQLWLAHGPGEIWSRRLGNNNPIGGVLPASNPSNPTISDRFAENEKQCIHLSFIGRMEGNMAQRRATFYDSIEALIGPIVSWDDSLNVHTLERLGRNQSTLRSNQLDIFDASGLSWNQPQNNNNAAVNNAAWEIEASSRVQMQSNTETGEVTIQAGALKYAAVSDTVRIEASPQQPAQISKTQVNAAPINLQVRSAAIRLKTGEMTVQIVNVEGALPQHMQGAGAPATPRQNQPGGQPAKDILPSVRDTPFKPVGRK